MARKSDKILRFGRTSVDTQKMAEVVKARRAALGLSQRELAERAGVGTTTVFNLEQGSCKIQLDIFLQILGALDLIPQQVLTIDETATPVSPTKEEAELVDLIRSKDVSKILAHLAKHLA